MAAAPARSLDIVEPQILVRYPDDRNYGWHMRLLIRRLRDAVWVWATPDGEIQTEDLSTLRLTALARDADPPAWALGDTYMFDAAPDPDELALWHAEAARMASVLGAEVAAAYKIVAARAHWLASDTGSELFGTQVPGDMMAKPAFGVVRGSVGLARISTAAGATLSVAVERVPDTEFEAWESTKLSGPGRDKRIASDRRDGSGRRFVILNDALSSFRPRDLDKIADWPHRGPRAVVEVLQGIRGAGREVGTFHELWTATSGAHPESHMAWEHKVLLRILQHMVGYDQLDVTNLSSAELLARRVVMLKRAVKANPAAPSFLGLNRSKRQAK